MSLWDRVRQALGAPPAAGAGPAADAPCEGLLCGSVLSEIGPPVILRSLAATVAAELEAGEPGQRYPMLAQLLARGRIEASESAAALAEWRGMREALMAVPVSRMRWAGAAGSANAPKSAPASVPASVPASAPTSVPVSVPASVPAGVPAGVPVDATAPSLATYLRTTTGRDLIFDVLIDNAECGVSMGMPFARVGYADVREVALRRG